MQEGCMAVSGMQPLLLGAALSRWPLRYLVQTCRGRRADGCLQLARRSSWPAESAAAVKVSCRSPPRWAPAVTSPGTG